MSDELFVVKHYTADDRPEIKGNGLDGITVGQNREEAEQLMSWVNARITRVRELEAERDDYVRYASKFAEERDALQDELRGCMENFDDACTTLAKLEAERDALRDDCHVLRMRADDAENENAILKAERDALRALLRVAFEYVPESEKVRIDAALKERT